MFVRVHKYMIRSIKRMTEKEKLMKSYEDLTVEEINETIDFVLALKAQRTQEPGEPLRQIDQSFPQVTS